MIPRQMNIYKILNYLREIESDVKANNYCGFYDINKISENFCKDLLNISFDLQLENVNLFKNNEKAIDLADKNKGIAIQVTSEKSLAKIRHTFNEYIDEGLDKIYSRLYIVTLVQYNPSVNSYEYKEKSFDIKNNVLDYRAYVKILNNKYDNNRFLKIVAFLDNELQNYTPEQINKYIEKLEFNIDHDLQDAIMGNRLYPYNVKCCPELPAVDKIEEILNEQNYCIISGEAGCGKSITAYQVGYRYFLKGWSVYRYINSNKVLEYDIFNSIASNSILIIDDVQIIENFQIDRIISKASKDIKIIITSTDTLKFNDISTTYISNQDSIEKLKEEYLRRKREIYPIVKRLDGWVKDSYGSETLEMRIERAAKEKTPWLFNLTLRGGWNKAKGDFKIIKERNRADKVLLILAILQILYLDKPISKLELIKKCEIWNEDNQWFENNFKYLLESKVVIEEYGKYRCAHIRYAIVFLNAFINNSDKEELDILLNYLRKVLENMTYPLQGIYWLIDNIDILNKGYYIRINVLEKEKAKDIVDKLFNFTNENDIRNSMLILDVLQRANKDILKIVNNEEYIKAIAKWIENVNENTGYVLGRIINNFFINEKLNVEILMLNINKQTLINSINSCSNKAIWHISEMLDRLLYAIENKEIKEDIISKIDIDILSDKINKNYKEMYLEEILNIQATIHLYNQPMGIELYNKTKESIKYHFNKDPLKAYEGLDNKFLWSFLGYSWFSNKQPQEKYVNIAKEILDEINIDKLADNVCNANLHDMERYSRFFEWIYNVNIDIMRKIVKKIDFNKIDINIEEYFKEPPRELRLFIYIIGMTEEKEFYTWMDKHIEEIQIADPLISVVYPKLVEKCIKNEQKIDIFGHIGSFSEALNMIMALKEYNEELSVKVIELSKNNIVERIHNFRYVADFMDEDVYLFFKCLHDNFEEKYKEIISLVDVKKVKKELLDYYKKEKDSNIRKNIKSILKYL